MPRQKKREFPRWRFNVLSPVDGSVIWAYDAFKVEEVHKKWKNDTGNSFLSRAKAVRACNGELNCPFIKCFKINQWAEKHLKQNRNEGVAPNSPTPSEFSTIDDYSTSGETDFETEDEWEELATRHRRSGERESEAVSPETESSGDETAIESDED